MLDIFEQPLPASQYAERAVLGSILLTGALPETPLRASDFCLEQHQKLYRLICAMAQDRQPISIVTVGMRPEVERDAAMGPAFVAALTDGLPRGLDVEHYSAQVVAHSARREAIALARSLAADAYAMADPADLARKFADAGDRLSGSSKTAEELSREVLLAPDLEREAKQYAAEIDARRMPTGIAELDRVIGGISAGQVLTIMARTGVGKSAIAQNICRAFLARETQTSAVFCSAEMPGVDLWLRQRQIESGEPEDQVIFDLRTGGQRGAELLARADQRFVALTAAGRSLREVWREIDHLLRRGKLLAPAVVIFDYAKLFRGDRATRSDTELVGQVAREVKIFAKDHAVAAILLSQVGRGGGDGSTEVTLSDARDSGEIEECADFVVGAWRPELHTGDRRVMRMALLKGRRCPLTEWDCLFDGRTLRIGGVV